MSAEAVAQDNYLSPLLALHNSSKTIKLEDLIAAKTSALQRSPYFTETNSQPLEHTSYLKRVIEIHAEQVDNYNKSRWDVISKKRDEIIEGVNSQTASSYGSAAQYSAALCKVIEELGKSWNIVGGGLSRLGGFDGVLSRCEEVWVSMKTNDGNSDHYNDEIENSDKSDNDDNEDENDVDNAENSENNDDDNGNGNDRLDDCEMEVEESAVAAQPSTFEKKVTKIRDSRKRKNGGGGAVAEVPHISNKPRKSVSQPRQTTLIATQTKGSARKRKKSTGSSLNPPLPQVRKLTKLQQAKEHAKTKINNNVSRKIGTMKKKY